MKVMWALCSAVGVLLFKKLIFILVKFCVLHSVTVVGTASFQI